MSESLNIADVFFAAIGRGDSAAVEALLLQQPGLIDTRNVQNVGAVLWALYHERAELAQSLAARRGRLDLAEQVALGHEAEAREEFARDPVLLQGYSDDGFTLLGLAVFFRQGALACWMIAQGAAVNAAATNAMRVAPIHAAVARSDGETLLALLLAGADPDLAQTQGIRPLHDAALGGKHAMAGLLLLHGARVDLRDARGRTAAMMAEEAGHAMLARCLRRFEGGFSLKNA
ncbi:ankyrin repeat protein [Tahibacter aquaticus]|uniref:Ankyrin repeat protein n=1 Tax=Tahibacter aquaticus TaxID=520092 RepID=A0A4R6Z0D2_9GAMM|nr:ankyrin repeat domain-containing protein [Tahibacter aquaticus]TDR44971.1 ankyrin repeat protein [Tahibacter aquaticus]